MGDARQQSPNRGPWIIAGGVIVAALIVVAALFLLKDDPCAAWQKDTRDLAERLEEWSDRNPNLSPYSTEQRAHNAEAQALLDDYERIEEDRPSGCEFPDLPDD